MSSGCPTRLLLLLCAVLCLAGAPPSASSTAPTIAFVPLDDRPVTDQLPHMLGEIAGQAVLLPPHRLLGSYLQSGDGAAILDWLRSPATDGVTEIVASSDMLAYGGLVASRVPGVSAGDAYVRLRGLGAIARRRGVGFVDVFATIMRLAPTGLPRLGAATDYYATGQTVDAIERYANLPDPPRTAADVALAARLRNEIGPPLQAYLATRARDRDVDEWVLQIAAEGDFRRVVIGQDDAGPVGLHLRDIARLRNDISRFGLAERASIEPGADELGMVMLARDFARNAGWTPTVAVDYSRPNGGGVVDKLEYVPIDTTIGRIIAACGAVRISAETERPADIDLFVRVPDTAPVRERAFEQRVLGDVGAGRSVAVADLTFLKRDVGPEQQELTQALIAGGIAGKIDAFASWNTDANTIGTALSEAIAVGAGRRTGRYDALAHAQFMLDRYVDDYAFHQFVRPRLNATLRAEQVDPSLLLPQIARETGDRARAGLWRRGLVLLREIYPEYADAGLAITLPWQRTFEAQIDVRLTSKMPYQER